MARRVADSAMSLIDRTRPLFEAMLRRGGVLAFLLLTSIGLVREVYDLAFYPKRFRSLAWLAPRPQVFVDEHYQYLKRVTVTFSDGTKQVYSLTSEKEWPVRAPLLITIYSLVHCLDRPQQIKQAIWNKFMWFYFCKPDISREYLKPELLQQPVKSVSVFVDPQGLGPTFFRNLSCSD